MKLEKEKSIIEKAVAEALTEAMYSEEIKHLIVRSACFIADKKGVNIAAYPYRQNFFQEILDKYFE